MICTYAYVRGNDPQVKMSYIVVPCQHCDDAPCIKACPIEGSIYRRPDGHVIIDPQKCSGCKNCVDACPYGRIYYNTDLDMAQKCTGCAHLLDRDGEYFKEPICIDACG
jgi:Fe-S-cluster-containing dehydrogenase component